MIVYPPNPNNTTKPLILPIILCPSQPIWGGQKGLQMYTITVQYQNKETDTAHTESYALAHTLWSSIPHIQSIKSIVLTVDCPVHGTSDVVNHGICAECMAQFMDDEIGLSHMASRGWYTLKTIHSHNPQSALAQAEQYLEAL